MTVKRMTQLGALFLMCSLLSLGCQSTAGSKKQQAGHLDGEKYVGKRVTIHCYAGGTYTGTVSEWNDSVVKMTSDDGQPITTATPNVATVIIPKPRTTPEKTPSKKTALTLLFKQKHTLAECANATANESSFDKLLLDYPDTLLFHDPDSVVAVRVPSRGEQYHVHILHRDGSNKLVDKLQHEGARNNKNTGKKEGNGQIVINLAKYPNPEHIVVVTWPIMEKQEAEADTSKGADDVQRALIPPFFMSLKLELLTKAEPLVMKQSFRHELQSPVGNIDVMVQPFNHGDMLLNMIDRDKKLPRLLWNMFPAYRPADATLAPRLLAEVYTRKGQMYQRIGIWPVPSDYPKQDPDAAVFALRTKKYEVISFAAPPQVDLVVPQERPGIEADIVASFTGISDDQPCRLIFAHSYADVEEGQYSLFAQDHEIRGDTKKGKYPISMKNLAASRFPLTISVAHRFVQPWKTTGGYFDIKPAKVHKLSAAIKVDEPSKIIVGKVASYYWFMTMHGLNPNAGGAMSPFALPNSGFSPNVNPGPGPGAGNGDLISVITSSAWSNIVNNGGGSDLPGALPAGGGGGGPGGGGGGSRGEKIIKQKCQGKKLGCQMPICKCKPHLWNMFNFRGSFPSMFPGAADFAWFGAHGDAVPCHTKTARPQAILRVKYNLPNAGFKYEYWDIYVIFTPCKFVPKGGPGGGGGGGAGFKPGPKPEDPKDDGKKDGESKFPDTPSDGRGPLNPGEYAIPISNDPTFTTAPLENEVGNTCDVQDIVDDAGHTTTGGGDHDGGGHKGKGCCCCCCCKDGHGVPGGDVATASFVVQ